jgi:dihydroorotase
MPNLVPPVVTGAQAAAYRDRIRAALPGADFTPLMTLYLTETSDPADIVAAHRAGIIRRSSSTRPGATTNSASGVRDFDRVRPPSRRWPRPACRSACMAR